jgi:predicted anti-sigma-YlaC factor YlaD
MHGSIRNRLEDLLGADRLAEHSGAAHHLSACPDCSAEVQKMRAQSEMLRMLRAPEEVEPSGGFYARVLQRIEEQARESIWAAFIYSRFADRLLYASLTVALVLGSYVIAHERQDGHLRNGVVADNVQTDAPVFGDQSQQRNAVLANFQAY